MTTSSSQEFKKSTPTTAANEKPTSPRKQKSRNVQENKDIDTTIGTSEKNSTLEPKIAAIIKGPGPAAFSLPSLSIVFLFLGEMFPRCEMSVPSQHETL